MVAAIETGVPALGIARDLMNRFHRMLRAGDAHALTPWLADTGDSLLVSFGKGVKADLDAVRAALTEPWSNGQTEGQNTKLKLIKRQMYGRAKLDLYGTSARRAMTNTASPHQLCARAKIARRNTYSARAMA